MVKNVIAVVAVAAITCVSCKKKVDAIDEYAVTDTTGILKQVADVPIGIGARLDLYNSDASYAAIVRGHFNSITFANELKHATIVSNEGAFNFSRADEFVSKAQTAGLSIHGHTLIDHLGINAVYLRSLTSSGASVNVVPNPGFETGSGNTFSSWTTQVSAGATGSFEAVTNDAAQGARAMKVNVLQAGPHQYSMQVYSDLFNVNQGAVYTLTFMAKAANHGSRLKAVVQNTTYQENTYFLTQGWERYSFTFNANEPLLAVKFHFPSEGVFYLDDLAIMKPLSGESSIDPQKVDNAMQSFISASVNRYKGKISSWDVVNEPFADGGVLRTTSQGGNTTGFYYADHLGKSYIAKAFQYANAADPSAILFLNEDKLESDAGKLDATIKLINELKAQGVPIHGVGLQMHLSTRSDRKGIETALTRLAATGLKIRISEMDVRMNPWNYIGYKSTEPDLIAQRDMYRFVVGAYHRLVPLSQRHGITFWDPVDKYSWIVTHQAKDDEPNLFDANYRKKPAYYGVIVGLRRKD